MQYRRSQAPDATFFFTVITYNRKRILCQKANVALIKDAFQYVIKQHPFRIRAFVLLPDHIHCIWTLPENDNAFSMRWRLIKSYFSRRCKREHKKFQSASRQSKGEQGIWQRRFWEHQIRNEIDFTKHVEYIHFNPVIGGQILKLNLMKMWDMNNLGCWVSLCSTQPTQLGNNIVIGLRNEKYDRPLP